MSRRDQVSGENAPQDTSVAPVAIVSEQAVSGAIAPLSSAAGSSRLRNPHIMLLPTLLFETAPGAAAFSPPHEAQHCPDNGP